MKTVTQNEFVDKMNLEARKGLNTKIVKSYEKVEYANFDGTLIGVKTSENQKVEYEIKE